MADLLTHVWTDAGNYCVSFKNGFFERWYTNVKDAIGFSKWCDVRKMDVWFSPAVFGDETRMTKTGKEVLARRQTNVKYINSLFFDLDCGEEKFKKGEGYLNQKAAFASLKGFTKEFDIPKPTVVSSGNGLHVYWLLDNPLTHSDFKHAANDLSDKFIEFGGILDTIPTKNSCTKLRFPGTRNFKDRHNPKAVKTLLESDVISIDDLGIDLAYAPPVGFKIDTSFTVPTDYIKVLADDVAERCEVVQHAKDVKGDLIEYERYALIQLLRHTDGGEATVHKWFTGRDSVTPEELQSKMDQLDAKDIGPTTCEKMNDLFPHRCGKCSYFGRITTPLQTLKPLQPLDEPKDDAAPVYPTRFGSWAISKTGVYLDNGDDEPEQVLNAAMHIDKVGRVDYDDAVATISFWSQMGTKHTTEMSLTILRSPQMMSEWLLSKGITGFAPGKERLVMKYLHEYADFLASKTELDNITRQLGWGSRGQFYYGKTMYSDKKAEKVRVSQNVPIKMVKGTEPAGTLAEWKKGMDLITKHDLKAMQFTVLAAMASPFLELINVQGAVVSLAGPSGTGKSTAMKLALSVFGDPEAFSLAPDATFNAADGYLRAANSFPIGIDEVSGRHMKTLQGLVYKAANGKAKERMTQDAELKDQFTWKLVTLMTTNDPLMDQTLKVLPEAERKRVVEIPMEKELPWEIGGALSDIFTANYGVAGHRFIKGLVRNRPQLEKLADKMRKTYHQDASIPDSSRFGVWLCAAAFAAGTLATKLGLIDFDVKAAVSHALDTMRATAASAVSPTNTIVDAIDKYINTNHGKIAILDHKIWVNADELARAPIAAVIVRAKDRIAIPVSRFNAFLDEENIPLSYLRIYRARHNIRSAAQLMMCKTMGGGQERCIFIPYASNNEETL